MGELADRVDTMHIAVSTPDGGITAELYGRDGLSLTFRDGAYRQFTDETELERRLEALAGRLWVARTREYWRIYGDVTGTDAAGDDPPAGERDRQWRAERDELVVYGSSAYGDVTIRSVGMRGWEVGIRPGTLRALDEWQFAAAAGEAAGELIRDQYAKLVALSSKHYGEE
ncbi:hypothetical protein [Actinoplanes sp. NPDC023714]|uniref:hypothetical protein n=1 Tax=Actinoplanes sp. NPDC023714 TaxID=3154322 RepID=UPI0033CD5168